MAAKPIEESDVSATERGYITQKPLENDSYPMREYVWDDKPDPGFLKRKKQYRGYNE